MIPKPWDRGQLVWPGCDDADVERATYLAVDGARSVKEHQVKTCGNKRSHATE
jgi:hypothetical protein